MIKTFTKILSTILFLFLSFIGYFSFIGFETTKFNNQIKENLKKIDSNLDVKLNDVKILLDIKNFNINAKTLGPNISYQKKIIEVELIKSEISLINLFNKEFSLSNLFISTKSVKLKDMIAFIRAVSNENKAELFILENFINKGYLIADINLNFDEQGNIREDFKINGLVKDGSINLLNKSKINKIDFIFESQNKNFILNDLKLSYDKINFNSQEIKIENQGKLINIEGQINNNQVILKEEFLENFFSPFLEINLKNLGFSSKNKFIFKVNRKFKIVDYQIKSLLDINEGVLKNDVDLKKIFPNSLPEIKLKNHKLEIVYKNKNLTINGDGELLIQKNYDQLRYKIKKNKDFYLFDIDFDIIDNPVILSSLNYKTDDQSKTNLKFEGKFIKNNFLNLKKIQFENGTDLIIIKDLKLKNDLKILSMKSAKFDFSDNHNKRNIFQIVGDKKKYVLSGKVLNASKLIDEMIFESSENNDIFEEHYSVEIQLKEVYLHEDHIVYDLKGNLKFNDNALIGANITSQFNQNENLTFTVNSENEQKVTTLFSDQAKPFVDKFDFIKGFNKGSLDFYSVKSKKTSNSKLKIYDFKLKELPALTKILTLASLQGIADLLSGDGIGFSEFEMNFENKDKLMTINEIYAIGPAISILMEGYIEKNKIVSLRGTLVPATTINKAIGSIPIIGDILVGKKTGEGVFGVSFKIKGPPKNLETSVNPIKTLTPRFITRTLEKIKKN